MKSIGLAVWNFLVIFFIFFPLLTGGIWLKKPGLFLELSEMAAPVLIVSVFGFFIHFVLKISLSETELFSQMPIILEFFHD